MGLNQPEMWSETGGSSSVSDADIYCSRYIFAVGISSKTG